ncbi:MAG: hypothetical protein JWO51_636 [Rhodospirillales bacterium]|nr:hypothetical protein [Rhodospirillales bacterium]
MIAKTRQATAIELDRGPWRWRNRVHWVVPGLLILLGVAVRAWRLAGNSFDPDEIWSYTAASLDWPGLIDMVAGDISHPPLFYALVKFALDCADGSVWSVRLVPLIAGTATLLATWGLCETLRLRLRETGLALFLVAVNSYFIEYAQYLRMFSLLQAMSVLSLWLFVRALDRSRPRGGAIAALTLANILLVYSHYWGWFFVAIEGLWALFMARRLLMPMILSVGVTLAAFAPWVYLAAGAARAHGAATDQIAWMERPQYIDILWLIDRMNGPQALPGSTAIGLVLFGVPIAAWLLKLLTDRRPDRLVLPLILIAFWAIPIGVTFWISHSLDRPVWGARHLIIAAVPYLILVSLAANRLIEGRSGLILPMLLVLWAGTASIETMATPGDRSFAWNDVIARIRQHDGAGPGPIAVFTPEIFVSLPSRFYGTRLDGRPLFVTTDDGFQHADGAHFWVLYRAELWRGDQTPQALLETRGFHVGRGFVTHARSQTLMVLPVDR